MMYSYLLYYLQLLISSKVICLRDLQMDCCHYYSSSLLVKRVITAPCVYTQLTSVCWMCAWWVEKCRYNPCSQEMTGPIIPLTNYRPISIIDRSPHFGVVGSNPPTHWQDTSLNIQLLVATAQALICVLCKLRLSGFNSVSNDERFQLLNLERLQQRRRNFDLSWCYKMLHTCTSCGPK